MALLPGHCLWTVKHFSDGVYLGKTITYRVKREEKVERSTRRMRYLSVAEQPIVIIERSQLDHQMTFEGERAPTI